MLARAIGGNISIAFERGGTRDVDDAPGRKLTHRAQHFPDGVHAAEKIRPQHVVPVLIRLAGERGSAHDTGIVHKDFDRPAFFYGTIKSLINTLGIGDIACLAANTGQFLADSSEPRLVAATARRYGLSRSLLVTWRRAFATNRAKSQAGFVRAVVAEDGPVAAPSSRGATSYAAERRIEIELAGGRRVVVDASVDVEALGRIIEVLDRR